MWAVFGTLTVNGAVLTSEFGPARRLGDGWTSISAFGPLSETQIACWHAHRSRSKRCCTRPLQRHDGVDLSVSPRSPEVSIHTQTSSRHRVGPNLTLRRPRRRPRSRKRPPEIIVILRRVAPNGSHLTLGDPPRKWDWEMSRDRRPKTRRPPPFVGGAALNFEP